MIVITCHRGGKGGDLIGICLEENNGKPPQQVNSDPSNFTFLVHKVSFFMFSN